jgi:hypothetical protein
MKAKSPCKLSMDTRWTRNLRNNRAYSLVEALIMTWWGISFVSLFAAFLPFCGRGFHASLRANVLLEKLETIRLYSWTQINQGIHPSLSRHPKPVYKRNGGFSPAMSIANSPVSEAYSVIQNWSPCR